MRTLNKLYVLLLEEYEKGQYNSVFSALLILKLKDKEFRLVTEDLRVRQHTFNTKQERIDFLKQMIEITKK